MRWSLLLTCMATCEELHKEKNCKETQGATICSYPAALPWVRKAWGIQADCWHQPDLSLCEEFLCHAKDKKPLVWIELWISMETNVSLLDC